MAPRRVAGRVVLAFWAAASLLVGSYTLAGHLIDLPAPRSGDPVLAGGLRALFPGARSSLWAAHVLYDRCGCSARVDQALRRRGPLAGVRETVVIVADQPAQIDGGRVEDLRRAGFAVATLSSRDAARRLHVRAVPLLVILDDRDQVRYAGGYTGRERTQLEDERLIADVRADRTPEALPIFGCATSNDLQKQIDPLGIKY
jgi:hypothetical protein